MIAWRVVIVRVFLQACIFWIAYLLVVRPHTTYTLLLAMCLINLLGYLQGDARR